MEFKNVKWTNFKWKIKMFHSVLSFIHEFYLIEKWFYFNRNLQTMEKKWSKQTILKSSIHPSSEEKSQKTETGM